VSTNVGIWAVGYNRPQWSGNGLLDRLVPTHVGVNRSQTPHPPRGERDPGTAVGWWWLFPERKRGALVAPSLHAGSSEPVSRR